tara:strand:+ start:7 stop:375 length:369 start_codon:yes stop_codon:yes gene_type:complete
MKNISIEFFFILLSFAFSMGLAQVIFSLASDQIFSNLKNHNLFNSILKSHWIYIGLLIYILATIAWIWILSKVDLRFAYPIASLSIIFAPLIKSYYENMYLGFKYWLGLVVIIIGIILISKN